MSDMSGGRSAGNARCLAFQSWTAFFATTAIQFSIRCSSRTVSRFAYTRSTTACVKSSRSPRSCNRATPIRRINRTFSNTALSKDVPRRCGPRAIAMLSFTYTDGWDTQVQPVSVIAHTPAFR